MVRVHLSPPNFIYNFVASPCEYLCTRCGSRLVLNKIKFLWIDVRRLVKKQNNFSVKEICGAKVILSAELTPKLFTLHFSLFTVKIWIKYSKFWIFNSGFNLRSHLENWTMYERQTRDRTLWHPSLKRSQCFLKRVIKIQLSSSEKLKKSFRGSHNSRCIGKHWQ